MGHITADRVKTAWKKLNKAEHLANEGQTYGAILECENALQELHRSSHSVDLGPWFVGTESPVRDDLRSLKKTTEPNQEDVLKLIEHCENLTKQTRDKVIPELNNRIDYEVSVNLE